MKGVKGRAGRDRKGHPPSPVASNNKNIIIVAEYSRKGSVVIFPLDIRFPQQRLNILHFQHSVFHCVLGDFGQSMRGGYTTLSLQWAPRGTP